MKTSTKVLIAIIGFLSVCLYCSQYHSKAYKEEAERQKANVEALVTANKQYIISDSIKVSEIKALTLSKKEFETLYKESARQVDALKKANNKIKPKSYTEATKTDTFIITRLDTFYIKGDTCTGYNDRYISFLYCRDTAFFETNDTIRQVISKSYKHKFLFWRFGDDGIKQEIWSTNPHTNLTYDKFIRLK